MLQHDVIEHLTSIGTWSGDALVELRLMFLRCVHPVESGVLEEIDAIVKEVLRWHIVLPIGLPHRAVADDEYNEYLIPAGTIMMTNVW